MLDIQPLAIMGGRRNSIKTSKLGIRKGSKVLSGFGANM